MMYVGRVSVPNNQCSKVSSRLKITELYLNAFDALLSSNVSSITDRNHWDSLAPPQQIPAAAVVLRVEHDMPGNRLKVLPS